MNFGRDDSDIEELDANIERVEFGGKFDAESIADEISSDIREAEEKAKFKDSATKKRENAEETFDQLRKFCNAQLNFSFRDVDRMIDSLIARSDEEVSPLLKFYNELIAHSNFRIPVRSML